jgi:hypothetical protein
MCRRSFPLTHGKRETTPDLDPVIPRRMKLRKAAATPHRSAKARLAPIASLAMAAPDAASLHGAKDLTTAANSPIAPP